MAASPPAPGRRKNALKSPVTWVIILGIAVAGGAYLLWRRNQAASTAAAAGTTGTADTTGTSDAGALGTLQSEIADLQSSEAQEPAGTGTGTTPPPPGTGTAPKAPPVITVINPGTGAADISWTAVPGAAGYELDITGPKGSAQASPKVSTTHARVSLPPGKRGLHVRVRAYNKAGAGPWSPPRTFNVGGGAARLPVRKAA